MDIEFRDAAKPGELSNFALGQALYRKAGFSNPLLVFDITRQLVVPEMAPLGTDKSLDMILKALSSETENIHLEEILLLPEGMGRNGGERPFQKKSEGQGMPSGKELATILNRLARLGEPEGKPVHLDRESDLSHLPVNSQKAIEARRVREITAQGEAFKQKTHFLLARELQRLLYDNRGPVDLKMQNATYELPLHLVDGERVQKAVYEVIDHFGSVGDFVRNGASLSDAVSTRRRMQELWTKASPKKEVN